MHLVGSKPFFDCEDFSNINQSRGSITGTIFNSAMALIDPAREFLRPRCQPIIVRTHFPDRTLKEVKDHLARHARQGVRQICSEPANVKRAVVSRVPLACSPEPFYPIELAMELGEVQDELTLRHQILLYCRSLASKIRLGCQNRPSTATGADITLRLRRTCQP